MNSIFDLNLLLDALILVIVLAMMVERALTLLFESPLFINIYKTNKTGLSSAKPLIAALLSIYVAYECKLDLLAIIKGLPLQQTAFGYFMTGLLIAGGSKASIKLFRDTLNISSSAYKAYKTQELDNRTRAVVPQAVREAENGCVR